jgi:hypothetical protein
MDPARSKPLLVLVLVSFFLKSAAGAQNFDSVGWFQTLSRAIFELMLKFLSWMTIVKPVATTQCQFQGLLIAPSASFRVYKNRPVPVASLGATCSHP